VAKVLPVGNARIQFAQEVSKQTGLNWYAVWLWTIAETGKAGSIGGFNFLAANGKSNSGVATTPAGYRTVKDAATDAAYRINHDTSLAPIKSSAGQSQAKQFTAIQKTLGITLATSTNIQATGKTSFGLNDITVKNPATTTEQLISGAANSLGMKIVYAFGVLGGTLLALIGIILIGADVGISELKNSKTARTVTGIGGAAILLRPEARESRAHAKSEKHLTRVRRKTETKTNRQRAANLKAGKEEIPKHKQLSLTDEEKADRKQIRHSAQGRIHESTGDDIPF
jgi:hypothetical protein